MSTWKLPASFKNLKFSDIDTNASAYITFGELRAAIPKVDGNASDDAIFNLFTKYCNANNLPNKV